MQTAGGTFRSFPRSFSETRMNNRNRRLLYSSWERGSNENANRVIQRHPKGSDLSKLTRKQIQQVEDWMSNYQQKYWILKLQKNGSFGNFWREAKRKNRTV